MEDKYIYTVIIIENCDGECGDVSTVSFVKYDDAIAYCLAEIDPEDKQEVQEELEEQEFYNNGDVRYYIESAKLIG